MNGTGVNDNDAGAQYWLAHAARDLKSARLLLDDGDVDGAANRLYYSMFHAVTAAFAKRQRIVKTHDSLVREFGRDFVATGLVSRELGRALNVALEMRRVSDYVMAAPDPGRVRDLFDKADALMAAVRVLVDAP